MPRIAARSVVLALLSSAAVAAPSAAQELHVGVWGGLTRSNEFTTGTSICVMDRCGPTTTNPHFWRRAPAGGVSARRTLGGRLALRGELAFAGRGYGPGDERSDWRVASQYLEAPLLAEVGMIRLAGARLHVAAGVAPAVLLACEVSGTSAAGFVTAGCSDPHPVTGATYGPGVSHDVGLVLAPGLRTSLGGAEVLVELRYTRGLVDTRPGAAGHTANRSTGVMVGTSWRVR
jgi:hypothetical protein